MARKIYLRQNSVHPVADDYLFISAAPSMFRFEFKVRRLPKILEKKGYFNLFNSKSLPSNPIFAKLMNPKSLPGIPISAKKTIEGIPRKWPNYTDNHEIVVFFSCHHRPSPSYRGISALS